MKNKLEYAIDILKDDLSETNDMQSIPKLAIDKITFKKRILSLELAINRLESIQENKKDNVLINWEELKEAYFNECTNSVDHINKKFIKFALSPSDLFSWFKAEINEYINHVPDVSKMVKKKLSGCDKEDGNGYCENNTHCIDKCYIEGNNYACMRAL